MREIGKFIVIIGVITTVVGLLMWTGFAPKWLGRLPGDIRIEREHSAFYFPIVTCIILSSPEAECTNLLRLTRKAGEQALRGNINFA